MIKMRSAQRHDSCDSRYADLYADLYTHLHMPLCLTLCALLIASFISGCLRTSESLRHVRLGSECSDRGEGCGDISPATLSMESDLSGSEASTDMNDLGDWSALDDQGTTPDEPDQEIEVELDISITCDQEESGLCDEVDNDCDGAIDEGCAECLEGMTRPCQLDCHQGMSSCVDGTYQECSAPPITPEICDAEDNDCDGQIDEGQVCSLLIQRWCGFSLGWAKINRVVPDGPWVTFPFEREDGCDLTTNRDGSDYSCDSTLAGDGLRMIKVNGSIVGEDHWLGLSWGCQTERPAVEVERPSAPELDVLNWAQDHCHVALGYRDYLDGAMIGDLSPTTCPVSSRLEENFTPRCIQTMSGGQYSILALEGTVNADDHFAIAFYCDVGSEAVETTERYVGDTQMVSHIMSELAIILGISQRNGGLDVDGDEVWDELSRRTVDQAGRLRGVYSSADGAFTLFSLSERLLRGNRFIISMVSR